MPDIRIVAPRKGNYWQPGTEHVVSFRVLHDEHPGEAAFRVYLNRGPKESPERVLSIDPSAAQWHSGAQSYSFDWQIPHDLPTGDDYFLEIVDRRTPTGANGEHFNLIGPIDAVTGGGTRYVSNPTRISWRIQEGSGINRVAIRLMHCFLVIESGTESRIDIEEVALIARGVAACQRGSLRGRYEWRVGGNRRVGGKWVFDCNMGEEWRDFPQEGSYFYRVSDTRNPETYCDGPIFRIRLPVITVRTEPFDDKGLIIHWDSEDLVDISTPGYEDYRARVSIEGRYDSGGRFECDRDPGFNSYFCIRTGWFRAKQMTWRWGESVPYPGRNRAIYPDKCQLPAQCSIKVSVEGFRWIARGLSPYFTLPCDGAPDPIWADYW
jgi:hypothetical protein